MVGSLRDITKQKNLEFEQLRIQKFESIGLLAGGIAHDYNNILVSILGNIQLLQLGEHLTEEQRDILTELQAATMHATDLTRQLLTFAKGGKPVRKLESILRIIEDSASFVLRSSKCRYACQVEDVIPLVNVDKAQMMQVMNNLLINAVQAMPEGGLILITLSLIDTAITNEIPLKTGKFVKIAVKDQGVGISKENQVKIFDLYFTTKEGGSGLGLPTSYSILKNHNGHLTFESLEHHGSTFYVYLPATEEFSVAEPIPTEAATINQNQRLKILVMDDNLEVHTYLRRILPKLNCEMTSCYDGQEAVDAYRRAFDQKIPYSLIIMDLLVPGGMGGKEATALIRKIDPNAKIIVCSGYANDPIIANYQENGFDGILAKPYSIDDLKKIFGI